MGSRGAQAPGLPWLMVGEGRARAAATPLRARAPLPVRLCRAARLVRQWQRRRSGPSPAWCRPRGGERRRRRPGRSRCQGAGRGAGLAALRRPRLAAFSAAPRAIRSAAPGGPGGPFPRVSGWSRAERLGAQASALVTFRMLRPPCERRRGGALCQGRLPRPAAAEGGWAPLFPPLLGPRLPISGADHRFPSRSACRHSGARALWRPYCASQLSASAPAGLRGPPSPVRSHSSMLSGCTSPPVRQSPVVRDGNLSFSTGLPVEYGGHLSSCHLQTPNALKTHCTED